MAKKRFVRRRRPPPDPLNLLVSTISGLLQRDMGVFINRAGLHPGFGLLHRAGADYALAADLSETFRSPIAEALSMTLLNQKILSKGSFFYDGEACRFSDGSFKTVVIGYESWMQRQVRDPITAEQSTWRGLCQMIVQRYAAFVDLPSDLLPTKAPFVYRMDY